MKIYFLILFYLFIININAQSICTPTVFPAEIFPPNSVSTPTLHSYHYQYLCGPNTILLSDTSQVGCRRVYIDNFSTLFLKPSCPSYDEIWVKSNCTLNIINGFGGVFVHVEIGAVINQPTLPHSYVINIDTCSAIVYPNINCTTGLNENLIENNFTIYPNPSTGEFRINSNYEINQIDVIDVSSQIVYSKLNIENYPSINLKHLDKGIYFLRIFYSNDLYVMKKVIRN